MGSTCGSDLAHSPCGLQCVVSLGSDPYSEAWSEGSLCHPVAQRWFSASISYTKRSGDWNGAAHVDGYKAPSSVASSHVLCL